MTEAAQNLEEVIEVVPGDDGAPVARATWGEYVFEEPLPRGIDAWPDDEMRAHLRRFVVPKLKFLIGKAKAGLFSPRDFEKLQAAREKRERKATKLRVVK